MKAQLKINGQTVDVELTLEQLQQLGIKEQATNKRWRANNGEHYWYWNFAEGVSRVPETEHATDLGCYNIGNYFKTEEEALKELNYILTRQRVKDAIAELNGDWKVDWNNYEQLKGHIEYNGNESKLYVIYNHYVQQYESWKVIKSEEILDQLKSMFTESELKLALFEIHE